MQSFWPTKERFLAKPTRPSRLFIFLFIFSATVNALLIVNLGYLNFSSGDTQRKLEQVAQTNLSLANKYKAERDDLQLSVAEKNVQLKQLNTDLTSAKKELSSVQQQLTSLNEQLKSQKAQLASNSAELEALRGRPPLFKFEKTTTRDVSTDEAAVKDIVTKAYDVINEIYGQPYLLNQIKISFVDALQIQGAVGEISITNSAQGIDITVKMTSFDKNNNEDVNTLVHELIHGFHGLAALWTPVLEEGTTVAATDAVIARLTANGTLPQSDNFISLSQEQAQQLNASLARPSSTESFYQSSNVGLYYQLAGWSWQQLYKSDSRFFINFNEDLYHRTQNGERVSDETVRQLIKENISGSVNGQSVTDFVTSQISFNPV